MNADLKMEQQQMNEDFKEALEKFESETMDLQEKNCAAEIEC